MKHNLKDRILTERIADPGVLSAQEREMVAGSRELQDLIAENRILAAPDSAARISAPPRRQLLATAMQAGGESVREQKMSLFTRMFAGRSPLMQFGLATLLIAVFSFAYVGYIALDSSPAWSMSAGNVLEYNLGSLPAGEDALQPLLDTYIAKVKEAKTELYGDSASDKKTVQISVNVEASSDDPGVEPTPVATLVISLLEEDPALLELIQAKIAEIPGAPVPVVQSALWFYGPEGPGQGGMRFKVEDQVFNFPDSATEEEIEKTIKDWLAENRPEKEFVVDITIERDSDAEGRERVKVLADIHEVGEESHTVGAEAKAPKSSR